MMNFRNRVNGSISIELFFYLLFFSMLMILSYELMVVFEAKNQANRISYSLVSAVRERSRDFESEVFSESELEDIRRVAGHILSDNITGLGSDEIDIFLIYPNEGKFSSIYTSESCRFSVFESMPKFSPERIDGSIIGAYFLGVCIDLSKVQYVSLTRIVYSGSVISER